jgi:hypothetical protein
MPFCNLHSIDQRSPKPQTTTSFKREADSYMPTPHEKSNPFELTPSRTRPLDLDGMTVMMDAEGSENAESDMGMIIDLEPVAEVSEIDKEVEELPWGNSPAFASWAPLMEEVPSQSPLFSSDYR